MPKEIRTTVYTYAELLAMLKDKTVSPKAVKRAAEWLRQSALELYNAEEMIEQSWTSALESIGFLKPEIRYSGFGSQGDGASFTASVDVTVLTQFLIDDIQPNKCIECDGKGRGIFPPWIVHKIGGKNAYPEFRKLLYLIDRGFIDYEIASRSSREVHEHSVGFSADLRDRGEWSERTSHTRDNSEWISHTPRVRKLFTDWRETIESLRVDLCRVIYKSLQDEYEYVQSDEAIAETAEANEYEFTIDGKPV